MTYGTGRSAGLAAKRSCGTVGRLFREYLAPADCGTFLRTKEVADSASPSRVSSGPRGSIRPGPARPSLGGRRAQLGGVGFGHVDVGPAHPGTGSTRHCWWRRGPGEGPRAGDRGGFSICRDEASRCHADSLTRSGVTRIPVSSHSSRTAASAKVSPRSSPPPRSSHDVPSAGLPRSRTRSSSILPRRRARPAARPHAARRAGRSRQSPSGILPCGCWPATWRAGTSHGGCVRDAAA